MVRKKWFEDFPVLHATRKFIMNFQFCWLKFSGIETLAAEIYSAFLQWLCFKSGRPLEDFITKQERDTFESLNIEDKYSWIINQVEYAKGKTKFFCSSKPLGQNVFLDTLFHELFWIGLKQRFKFSKAT